MDFDENSPYRETPAVSTLFHDDGDIRTLQHRGTALVHYNPLPISARFKRLRTGMFRPLHFSTPRALYVGDLHVPNLSHIDNRLLPVAIDEGSVYIGIIPMRLTDLGQCKLNHLQVHTYGDHMAVVFSSFEDWAPKTFTYEQIMSVCSGFVLEVHPAKAFASFADFRRFLAEATLDDMYYAKMRTTTYRRKGLELSTCYSPYQSAFRHATINGAPVDVPVRKVQGMADPMWGPKPAEPQ
jgi:hypothetical protein